MTTATRRARRRRRPTTAPACRTVDGWATDEHGVRVALGRLRRRGDRRRSCSCRRRRSSTRASGRARSRTSPATTGSSRSTAAATGGRTGRPTPTPTAGTRIVGDVDARARRHRDGPRRSSSACAATPSGRRSSSRRATRTACCGIVAFAVGVPLLSPAAPVARAVLVRGRAAGRTRAGPRSTATPGVATTRASRGSSSRAITTEPHSTKVIEDAVEWALRRLGRRDARGRRRRAAGSTARPSRRDRRRSAARCCSSTAPRTTASRSRARGRLAELTGAPLVVVEGADHMIPGRHPVLANLLIRDFVHSLEGCRPMTTRTWTRALSRKRRVAVHLLADRAGPRDARRSRSPRSSAGSTPTSRSTGSPSTR